MQKDVGMALSFLPIFGVLAFCGGARRKVIITMAVIVLLVAPLVWFSLKDYHRERIKSMFDPEYDSQGIGYQSAQAKIAVGSGKIMGKGILKGSQSRLGFLPGRHTDFIYAVLAEETGFVGAATVLFLYLFMLWRLGNIVKEAKERFGSMIVLGVLSILLFHVIINIGMVLGLMPIIGIPLPFLSYGGSSLISNFLALGLVLNVGMRRYVN
jgi:rod shape determining protein RodA